jgi:hypothetical protein
LTPDPYAAGNFGNEPLQLAGFTAAPQRAGALVSGKVSVDSGQDADLEPVSARGVPDVVVELRDHGGEVVATSVTDSGGIYKFEDVAAGDYVRVISDVRQLLIGNSLKKGLVEHPLSVYMTSYGAPIVEWEDGAEGDEGGLDTVVAVPDPDDGDEKVHLDDVDDAAGAPLLASASEIPPGSTLPWMDGFEALSISGSDGGAARLSMPQTNEAIAAAARPGDDETNSTTAAVAHTARATRAESDRVDEAPDTASESTEEAIPALMSAAELAFEEDRLSIPGDHSAVFYYRKILEIDPNSAEALAGIDGVVERYVGMAEDALDVKDEEQARRYIARGLRLNPGHQHLLTLQEQSADVILAEVESPPEAHAEPPPQGFLHRLKIGLRGNGDGRSGAPATQSGDGR